MRETDCARHETSCCKGKKAQPHAIKITIQYLHTFELESVDIVWIQSNLYCNQKVLIRLVKQASDRTPASTFDLQRRVTTSSVVCDL